jgi:hypothetical protein
MAKVVAAMAMTHSPGLTGWFERAPMQQQLLAKKAMDELRWRLEAAKPDVILGFSNDHLLNWPINNVPEFTVGIGEEHVGPADWYDEWLALEVGVTLREMLKAYPDDLRVAVLATGGLSHEPGGPRYFWVDEEFDQWFMAMLARGDHEALLRECTLEKMEEAGSGGTAELLAWIMALAFTRGPAEVLAYMPAVAWRSGTGMVVWSEMA